MAAADLQMVLADRVGAGGAVRLGDGHDPAGLLGCPPVVVPLANDLAVAGDEKAFRLGDGLGGDLFELGRIEAEFRRVCFCPIGPRKNRIGGFTLGGHFL